MAEKIAPPTRIKLPSGKTLRITDEELRELFGVFKCDQPNCPVCNGTLQQIPPKMEIS